MAIGCVQVGHAHAELGTIAIIQARVGSTRLPGKVMADVGGAPILGRVVERARRARLLDDVVVATSFAEADMEIVRWCQRAGVIVRRGGASEDDVLGRYRDAALLAGADVVVRLTADCPLLDPDVVDAVIAALSGYDYASNVDPPTYPDGLDAEAFTLAALLRAYEEARLPSEREHVTPWMRANLRCANVGNPLGDLSAMRWTVDDARDLAFVRAVYGRLGEPFGMADVLALLGREPGLAALNAGTPRNEGYAESMKGEQ